MKKKWLASLGIFVLLFVLALSPASYAAAPVKLIVNGREIIPDVTPQIIDGRVMAPVRSVAEALGATVEWDNESKTVIVTTKAEDFKNDAKEIIDGIWQGNLSLGGEEIRIVFHITLNTDGTLTAAMDSPDQGAFGLPADKAAFENGSVYLEVNTGAIIYEGNIKEGGQTIEGLLKEPKMGVSLPLTLDRVEQAPVLNRPQEPKGPYPYDVEEVVYENEKAGLKLAGTLTLPRSAGPHPAVLLISGSGPQNRDEEVYGHRIFWVLADYLTRQDIAVLRVDDRGVGGSTGDFSLATSEDFAGDALAGVEFLKGRVEVDPGQIGLIGHSEGGMIAPMAAAQSPDVAFIVMMAGPGLSGADLLQLQSDLILRALGVSEETIAVNSRLQEQVFNVVKQGKDPAAAERKLREIITGEVGKMSEKDKEVLGYQSPESVEAEIRQVLSPWLSYFITYDPRPALMQVKIPVLAINGEKDLQVPPKENLGAVKEALEAGGNKQYTVLELPGLNHAFQTVTSGSGLDYAKIEETISPSALKVIGDWILQQAGDIQAPSPLR